MLRELVLRRAQDYAAKRFGSMFDLIDRPDYRIPDEEVSILGSKSELMN
jgi:hypothetical protein